MATKQPSRCFVMVLSLAAQLMGVHAGPCDTTTPGPTTVPTTTGGPTTTPCTTTAPVTTTPCTTTAAVTTTPSTTTAAVTTTPCTTTGKPQTMAPKTSVNPCSTGTAAPPSTTAPTTTGAATTTPCTTTGAVTTTPCTTTGKPQTMAPKTSVNPCTTVTPATLKLYQVRHQASDAIAEVAPAAPDTHSRLPGAASVFTTLVAFAAAAVAVGAIATVCGRKRGRKTREFRPSAPVDAPMLPEEDVRLIDQEAGQVLE